MEAPTPVRALVHRRTLVVAGYMLHLIVWGGGIRLNSFFRVFGVLTIFLGGLNILFESDIKKWIAFSTGLNMGILFTILSYGWFLQSLNHMGAHAFYKRGMFLCAGIVLISRFGSQDIRSVVKRGEGFIFFLCSLGVLLVPTFFSKHAIFSFLNEGSFPILGIFASAMLFLIWTTVSFFMDYSRKVVKARGVLEIFLALLLTWNLSSHSPIDLSCFFNWAFLVVLGALFCVKAKGIGNSTSLKVYQSYFTFSKLLWYEAKVWLYYMTNR